MRVTSKRAWLTWLLGLAVVACLSLGFWAFAYQGYREDSGSAPVQSWPYGPGLFAAAGVLIVLMIRRALPDLTGARLGLIAVALALLLLFAAFGSLGAGGNSFEF